MKNKIITFAFVTTFILVAVVILVAQGGKGNDVIPEKQINESIQAFSGLVNAENAKSFGLRNAEELKSLKAGKQFKKYMIELNDIKKFTAADSVEKITRELPAVNVALIDANGQIKTAIEYTMNKERWEVSRFGMTGDMLAIQGAQQIIDSAKDGRLISIPSLQTNFYEITSPQGKLFIPLSDNEGLGFKKGIAISSAEALKKLVKAANDYNGLPY
jgi:hypothetical protein